MRAMLIGTIATIAIVTAGHAECSLTGCKTMPRTAEEWLKERPIRSPDVEAWCYCFVVGFSEAFEVWALPSPTSAGVCLPHEASVEQLLELGNRFIRLHPEM